MIYRYWDVSLVMYFSCMFIGVDNLSELPPPRNLTVSWDQCYVTAQWREPTGLDSECKVNYTVILCSKPKCPPKDTAYLDKRQTANLSYKMLISNDNEICLTIMTNPLMCENKKKSKPVHQCISPPKALVNNFSCVCYSDKKMSCSWNVLNNTSDIQFHYRIHRVGELLSINTCNSYITNGSLKTGCHINSVSTPDTANMCFIIEGTAGNLPAPNIFLTQPHVKPWPPKLKIIREGEDLRFLASPPDFLNADCWQYKYMYSKCQEKVEEIKSKNWSVRVPYDVSCKYTVRVQTENSEYCGKGASDWSETEYYGEDVDPNWPLKVAVIVVPLIITCCLITALVLFKRHKDIIFPTVPQPSLLFKDMLNSSNDGLSKNIGVGKLYVPITEVVEKDVSLEQKNVSLYPGP